MLTIRWFNRHLYPQFRMNINKVHNPFKIKLFSTTVLPVSLFIFTILSCSAIETSVDGDTQSSATEDYLSDREQIRYEDWVYTDNIRTDQLHGLGDPLSSPFFELNMGSGVEMSFDDMDADYKDYYYTVIHCDASWRPTDMLESQYLRGFREAPIENYEYSFNTFNEYTNYRFQFPNQNMGVKVSGNYLLVIYQQGRRDEPAITKRFVVYEKLVDIAPKVKQATVVSERRNQQEVDFTVYHKDYPINNPNTNLNASILQNTRWDNAVMRLKPKFVKQKELVYDYDRETTFDGGNEFRMFDLKHLKYTTLQVDSIRLYDRQFHAFLTPDMVRRWESYRTVPDINGRYLIKNDEVSKDHVESHYVMVHFTLPYETDVPKADFYIFGGLSNYHYRDEFKMSYDYQKKAYTAEVLLKQGYYNYQYLMLSEEDYYGDVRPTEGSHFQTQNEYAIFLYNKEISRDYDRVVGAAFIDSFEN